MRFYALLTSAVSVLTVFPSLAEAQSSPDVTWLKDRRYTEGIGIRAGNFELHPGVGAEFGYDSNYLLRGSREQPAGSLHLKVIPSFSISTLSPQRRGVTPGAPPPTVEFRGGINGTYNEFIPVTGTQPAKDLLQDQRNITGALDLSLSILPGRPWSGTLYGDVARNAVPSSQGVAGSYDNVSARAGGELAWAPGGGLFEWRLGYSFLGKFFEEQSTLTNLTNEVSTRGRWRFLPRTAMLYDARLGFIDYTNGKNKTGSHPLRARIGMNGLVTHSVGILAMVGWGSSFYTPSPQEDFDSVIGQAEVRWYLTPNPSNDPAAATLSLSSLAAGFTRDFVDSYIGTYYASNRGYASFSYFFGGKFLLVAEGGAAAIQYPNVTLPVNIAPHAAWTDVRIDASLFGEYRFKDAFGVNLSGRYDGNVSNTVLSLKGGSSPDELAYNRFQVYLGVRWFM
jgi:hypothetical protein